MKKKKTWEKPRLRKLSIENTKSGAAFTTRKESTAPGGGGAYKPVS